MILVKGIIINEAEIKISEPRTTKDKYGVTVAYGVKIEFKDGTGYESDQFTTADIMAEIVKKEEEERKRRLY